jgi:hypothetical protein
MPGSRLGYCQRRCWPRRVPAPKEPCCFTAVSRRRSSAVPGRRASPPDPQGDEWGDLDVAHQLTETIETAELFLYPGDRHLFADNSLPDYDESAATLLKRRVLTFLDDIA